MTEAGDVPGGVVPVQGGEVDAGGSSQEPGRLPLLLDGAAGLVGGGPPLDRREVDAGGLHPTHV